MKITSIAAASLLCIAFAACTTGTAPRVRVSAVRLSDSQRGGLRDHDLARALDEAVMTAGRRDSQERYNAAVARFVIALQKRAPLHDWTRPIRIGQDGRSWEVSFDHHPLAGQGRPEWSPGLFDRILPASGFRLTGYDQIVRGDGLGVPCVLAFEDIARLRRERQFRPGNGIYVPGTVILEIGAARTAGAPVPVRMRILNTFTRRRIRFAGADLPLAYHITAAVEMTLSNPYIAKSGIAGLMHPGSRLNDLGIFGLTEYEPGKIPVLFIHGIKSDVRVWRNTVNQICAEPGLAARYQPLLFLYPTGLNIAAAASRLRDSIAKYRARSDLGRNDSAFNRMVIVGHSMGGLLARLQVMDSGDDLWRAFLSRPVREAKSLTDEQARKIENALVFRHQPFVKRVIFVAVPHRGTEIADWRLVRLFIRTIKLPTEVVRMVRRVMIEDRAILNPALFRYHMLGLRSVDMLSPDHPYIAALDKRPILVPFHSIIGDRGRGDTPESSDGVVPYWSSHRDGAASEKIVPYGHGGVAKTETVREILRILRFHSRSPR